MIFFGKKKWRWLLCIKKKKNLDTFVGVVAKYKIKHTIWTRCVWDPLESFLFPIYQRAQPYIYIHCSDDEGNHMYPSPLMCEFCWTITTID